MTEENKTTDDHVLEVQNVKIGLRRVLVATKPRVLKGAQIKLLNEDSDDGEIRKRRRT